MKIKVMLVSGAALLASACENPNYIAHPPRDAAGKFESCLREKMGGLKGFDLSSDNVGYIGAANISVTGRDGLEVAWITENFHNKPSTYQWANHYHDGSKVHSANNESPLTEPQLVEGARSLKYCQGVALNLALN